MEKSLAESLQTIEASHGARSASLTTSLNVARIRCAGGPDAVMLETWKSWLLAMQVYSAAFAAASTDHETVTCKISQEERHLDASGTTARTLDFAWRGEFDAQSPEEMNRGFDRSSPFSQAAPSLCR